MWLLPLYLRNVARIQIENATTPPPPSSSSDFLTNRVVRWNCHISECIFRRRRHSSHLFGRKAFFTFNCFLHCTDNVVHAAGLPIDLHLNPFYVNLLCRTCQVKIWEKKWTYIFHSTTASNPAMETNPIPELIGREAIYTDQLRGFQGNISAAKREKLPFFFAADKK